MTESLSRASVPQDADEAPSEQKEALGPFGEGAPYVVLEHLIVQGHSLVRVVCTSTDESTATKVASELATAGMRVWFVDLWGEEPRGPTIERYVGEGAAALWLMNRGESVESANAGDKLTDAGW